MTVPVHHGDPETMRMLASVWLARAEHLADVGGEIPATVAAAGFEGPAAQRLEERAAMLGRESSALAETLQTLAFELRADADAVEIMNTDALRIAEEEAALEQTEGGAAA